MFSHLSSCRLTQSNTTQHLDMLLNIAPSIGEPTLQATHVASASSASTALAGSIVKLEEALATAGVTEAKDAARRVRGAAAWCAGGEVRIVDVSW